ncbi:MAG TPA: site-specific DNA-methyltransferase [Abditibacteriaceae bacterium]|jgi:site-specific DNA-methyltransferase (adenine-specific)
MIKPYQLHLGDCLEVMRGLESNSVDLVLTDPPYATTACKWDVRIDWAAWWKEVHRIAKKDAATVCFSAQPFTSDLIISNRKKFRHEIVWEKMAPTGFLNANRRPLTIHENILVFCQSGQWVYNPQKTTGHKPYYNDRPRGSNVYSNFVTVTRHSDGERYPKSILKAPTVANQNKVHPTEKPAFVLEWLLRSYSNEGAVVFDPFAGSGSTGAACKNTNRSFIGIERESNYFEIAKSRIEVNQ